MIESISYFFQLATITRIRAIDLSASRGNAARRAEEALLSAVSAITITQKSLEASASQAVFTSATSLAIAIPAISGVPAIIAILVESTSCLLHSHEGALA
ncbi:MAG TPA: hypothetical protein PKJ56_12605 [Promineifilum sp.]|nr:hypothetical protein [Promineifilum sp.]